MSRVPVSILAAGNGMGETMDRKFSNRTRATALLAGLAWLSAMNGLWSCSSGSIDADRASNRQQNLETLALSWSSNRGVARMAMVLGRKAMDRLDSAMAEAQPGATA